MPENLAKDGGAEFHTTPEKDYAESKRVCRAIGAAIKRCWRNARKVIEQLDEYASATYIEGWIVKENGALVEHGWIVLDGKIIDPTLPEIVATYFSGLEFTGRAGIAAFLGTPEHKSEPFHYAFGLADSPSYQQAFRAAMEYSNQRASNKEGA
jgi:hypothetical protein